MVLDAKRPVDLLNLPKVLCDLEQQVVGVRGTHAAATPDQNRRNVLIVVSDVDVELVQMKEMS